MLEFKI